MPHVGDGAHLVVGQAVDDHRDAAGGIAFVADFLVFDAFQFAGGLLDRALDHVLGHVRRQRLVDRDAQPRIVRRLAATGARGDRNLADDLGEDLAAPGILGVLAAFDGGSSTHWDVLRIALETANFTAPRGAATNKGLHRAAAGGKTSTNLPAGTAPGQVGRNRPLRRNATVWSTASAENSRPLWLASTTTWSLTPGNLVSSIATVPSWSPSNPANSAPSPWGTQPAITPTSARPSQQGNPFWSRAALRPSIAAAGAQRSMPVAAPLPVSGEPRHTTRPTCSNGASHNACSAINPPRLCATISLGAWPSISTRRGTAVSGPSATLW